MGPQTTERQQSSTDIFFRHIAELTKTQVNDSDEYWKLRGEGIAPPEAVRQTAELVASDTTNELSGAERSLLVVVGNLGSFVQAQYNLEQLENKKRHTYLPSEEMKIIHQLKDERIIPFNHDLKEFVNTHPNDELRAVSAALANTYDRIFSRYDCLDTQNEASPTPLNPNYVLHKIQSALNGMRHEVAAETLLDAANFTYDYNVTTQQDAKGSDLFVLLGSRWQGVDIKASQSGAEKSSSKNRFSRAVTTGLTQRDFTGTKGTGYDTLSIPFSVAQEKAPDFISGIYEMANRTKAQRKASARRVGRQTLRDT